MGIALALAASMILSTPVAETISLTPTDDVWVYPHASDPEKDPFLRVWGSEDRSVAADAGSIDAFSYSYLKFDVSSVSATAKITDLKLVLTHIPNKDIQEADAKACPLEVRPVSSDFTEKTWNYDLVGKISPDPKVVYGKAALAPSKKEGEDFKVEVSLLKDGGAAFMEAVKNKKPFAVALTSKIDPANVGRTAIYKFYSKDGEKAKRPQLVVISN